MPTFRPGHVECESLLSEIQEPPVSTMSIPYIEGLSKDIKRIARNFNIRTVFTPQRTLRQSLTRVKDQLLDTWKAYVVYRVTCSCGKVYIGETQRTLGTRIKEHQDAYHLYRPEKPAVAEHAWCSDHRIDWDAVEIVDTASKKMELLVKEVIHIQRTPKGLLLNRDNGWQIPESWNATLRTDMMSSTEARRPEQSVDREAQAMEMDS